MSDLLQTIEHYKGFELTIKFQDGKFQGQALHRFTGNILETVADSTEATLNTLKQRVDEELDAHFAFYRQALIKKHRDFLATAKKPDLGHGAVSRGNRIRHCYQCMGPLDSAFDIGCQACGWMICSFCAACGCDLCPATEGVT